MIENPEGESVDEGDWDIPAFVEIERALACRLVRQDDPDARSDHDAGHLTMTVLSR